MTLIEQNERLLKEMPALMQIQYGLNTSPLFSLIKNVTALPENTSQRSQRRGVIGKDRCPILFSEPGMRPIE